MVGAEPNFNATNTSLASSIILTSMQTPREERGGFNMQQLAALDSSFANDSCFGFDTYRSSVAGNPSQNSG